MNSKKPEDSLPRRWIGCPIEADYFGEERKSSKRQRKMALAKDRSKYKTTDQRQRAKMQKVIKPKGENQEQGRVLSIASQEAIVDAAGEKLSCMLRGVLKKDKHQSKNLLAVGDLVLFEKSSPNEGVIVQILPRHSVLSRAENLSRKKEQLIAANIDQVIITTSVMSPLLKPSLIDRYIIATQKGNMEPIIVVNKIDLLQEETENPTFQQEEKARYQELLLAYQIAKVPLISISVLTGEGLEDLKQVMRGKASVFSGQSGVGKSSLINAITGGSLPIGEMVEKTKKGTHTTSSAQLLQLEFGGWCIDTPGIKSFGVWNLNKEEIEHHFPEIFECGHHCRFPDCSHFHEEECAVIGAVERREISPLRYESYLSLMESIEQNHFRR